MLKQIAFAYPSSVYAVRFGRSASGCYLVETAETIDGAREVVSVHNRLVDAVARAETLPCDWSPLYRNRPLPGHTPA